MLVNLIEINANIQHNIISLLAEDNPPLILLHQHRFQSFVFILIFCIFFGNYPRRRKNKEITELFFIHIRVFSVFM